MHMGNLRVVGVQRLDVMSTDRPPVGIDHLTVVPMNFDPDARRRDDERDEQGSGSGRPPDREVGDERLHWARSAR